MPEISYSAARRLAARAALLGEKHGRSDYTLDASGVCVDPRSVTFKHTPEGVREHSVQQLRIYARVPCNDCELCRWSKRKMWQNRMRSEILRSNRTWFLTLTASPEAHAFAEVKAKALLRKRGITFATDKQNARARSRVYARDIQLFQKRLRKAHGTGGLRFLGVMELHKSGLPHYHMLIHETGLPVSKRQIERAWHLGFSKPKLVDMAPEHIEKACEYVAKYISKDGLNHGARIICSLKYGAESA